MENLALSVARGRGLADPFLTPTGPSAWYPPIYPLLYSLNYRLLGTDQEAELGKLALNVAGASLGYAVLPWVAQSCGLSSGVGVMAGLFGAALPISMWGEVLSPEMAWNGLLLALLTAWMARVWKAEREYRARSAILHGLAWGIVVLAHAIVAVVPAAWTLAAFALPPRPTPYWWRKYHAAMVLSAVLTISPWVLRNYLVLGHFVPLKSNFGLVVWVSNNPETFSAAHKIYWKSPSVRSYDPMHSPSARAIGEVEYNRRLMARAREWIAQNPSQFAWLTVQRMTYFWFPLHTRTIQAAAYWALTVLAWVGLAMWLRKDRCASLLIALIWLSYPVVYYLVYFDLRYRQPLNWSLLALGAYTIRACRGWKPSWSLGAGESNPHA